jgi:hypothetical protein
MTGWKLELPPHAEKIIATDAEIAIRKVDFS